MTGKWLRPEQGRWRGGQRGGGSSRAGAHAGHRCGDVRLAREQHRESGTDGARLSDHREFALTHLGDDREMAGRCRGGGRGVDREMSVRKEGR